MMKVVPSLAFLTAVGCVFIASTVDFVNGGYPQKEQATETTKKLNVKKEVNQDYAPATERRSVCVGYCDYSCDCGEDQFCDYGVGSSITICKSCPVPSVGCVGIDTSSCTFGTELDQDCVDTKKKECKDYCEWDYEYWNCQKCQETNGYTYCKWKGQFNDDGGCLPDVGDGVHTPCVKEAGDVIVDKCPEIADDAMVCNCAGEDCTLKELRDCKEDVGETCVGEGGKCERFGPSKSEDNCCQYHDCVLGKCKKAFRGLGKR